MDERGSESPRAAAAFVALIALLTFAVIFAPRFELPKPASSAPVAQPSNLPTVEVWLSTADRRLKLVEQTGIAMNPRVGDEPADVVIDVSTTFQSMVGFGAAMTD